MGQIHNLDRDTIILLGAMGGNWLAMNQVEFDIAWRDIFVPYSCRGLLMAMFAVREKDHHAPHNRLYKDIIRNLWPEVLCGPVNPNKAGRLIFMQGKLRTQAKRSMARVSQFRRWFEQGE